MLAHNYIQNYEDVRQHILSCYPEEGCGIVIPKNIFIPLRNISELDRTKFFAVDAKLVKKHKAKCILHSHITPDHPFSDDPRIPSKFDMESQINSNKEFAIVATDGKTVTEPYFWGDYDHRPPLMDREFIHSMQDCYSFVSDWLYKESGIKLPGLARNFDWFETGEDYFTQRFEEWGFKDVSKEPEQRGDLIIYQIRSEVPNHVGVIIEPNLMAHHYINKFPNVEPTAIRKHREVRRIRYAA